MTRPFQGALIGFGFIAEKGHVPAYLAAPDQLEIVAVADICAARREKARQVLPHARIYSDTKTLLQAEAKNLDFVDIATPPCDHAAIAHAAFEHGLHVFCEKPIATSAADARAMLDHATAAKKVFFPSHNYKHAPVIKAIRKVLESGELGPIHLVTLDTFRTTHAKGVPEWQTDWRRSRATSGGGIAMDHGSHTFYLAFDWLASQPTAITAKMSNLSTFDTEDNFNCTVTFPTGIAVAQLTWNAGFRKVIYTIHGANGAIKVEDDEIEIHRKRAGGTTEVEKLSAASHWMDASHAEWFKALQAQFVAQIRSGQWVGQEARDAAMCVQLIETAYASARADGKQLAIGGDRAAVIKAG
ncbi:MAG TPA: Gfo/Idh/MocA family oxidoreductase [Kofleriaceae bacterium]|nr:Gfo/Idh/MocA family oxidoreductase [Kofleriaceae bacterium]